jgi:hypothetical protein
LPKLPFIHSFPLQDLQMVNLMHRYAALVVAFFALRSHAATVQDQWKFPQSPDLTSTLYQGNQYMIAWESGLVDEFSQYCSSCVTSDVELWVTGGSNYAHQVSSGKKVAPAIGRGLTYEKSNADIANQGRLMSSPCRVTPGRSTCHRLNSQAHRPGYFGSSHRLDGMRRAISRFHLPLSTSIT